jgi:hypothetical protein
MFLHAHTTAPDIQMMTQLIGHEKVAFCPQDKTWLYNLAFKPLHLGFLIVF